MSKYLHGFRVRFLRGLQDFVVIENPLSWVEVRIYQFPIIQCFSYFTMQHSTVITANTVSKKV